LAEIHLCDKCVNQELDQESALDRNPTRLCSGSSQLKMSYLRRSPRTMSNTYGISENDEREIRARDKTCVYCGVLMKQSPHATGSSGATLEHFNNDGPLSKRYNVAICCRGCNSSKGTMGLSVWFKTPYCRNKKINRETVSKLVKEYMRLEKLS
jgi:5-methylcytosine-specific restriction endonuclease McrA